MNSRPLAFLIAYLKARHLTFSTRANLEAYQQRQLIPFLKKVRKASLYYQELWSGIDDADWTTFPMIDKKKMMDHFSTLNTAGIDREEAFQIAFQAEQQRDFSPTLRGITIGLSSGTSGHRGLFLVSPDEQASWAGMVLGKLLPSSLVFGERQRIAFFLRANSNLYESVNRRKIQFSFYDLMLPIEHHLEQLQQQNPTLLIAPASVLKMLAVAQNEKRIQLQPKKIIAVAEVLEPVDRLVLEHSFKQIVHQVYQCTEGFLGSTCAYGTMHLNESQVIVEKEYLDEERTRFVPIITDFRRFTQPIIRYRHNDVLHERKQPCPCGSPMLAIESIEGRCDDLFYIRAKSSLQPKVVFPDFIRRALMQVKSPIEEYKVVQTSLDRIEVQLQVNHANQADIRSEVVAEFEKMFALLQVEIPYIEVSFDYLAPEKGVKLRRIQRHFEWGGV